jgi:predicted nucleic acid-binding protein
LPDLADAHGVSPYRHPSAHIRRAAQPDEALGNVAALVELPHVRVVSEQDGFLDAYKRVAGDMPVRGNLVPDAHVAAILFQHGVRTLYTNDRDFRKFEFLEVRDPFS